MKKKEVNLSKEHVDLFKTEPKSHTNRLAYTTAGWAVVTHDGTILEVIDAFQGAKQSVLNDFISRNEIASSQELDETKAKNPTEIGLKANDPRNDSTDLFGEIILAPSVACSVPALLGSTISSDPDQGYVANHNEDINDANYVVVDYTALTQSSCEWVFLTLRDSDQPTDPYPNTGQIQIFNDTNVDMEIYTYRSQLPNGAIPSTTRNLPYVLNFEGDAIVIPSGGVEMGSGYNGQSDTSSAWFGYEMLVAIKLLGTPDLSSSVRMRMRVFG